MRSVRRAFTLVELMVAVAVLIVVILVTARLFGTASKVAGLGEATEDVAQEITAIQRQLRDDLRRLSEDGYFIIRSQRVPNNVNDPLPLLDPTKPADAFIRSDQILFFANGLFATKGYVPYVFNEDGSNDPDDGIFTGYPQATEARFYYGHAFQLPDAEELVDYDGFSDDYALRPWSVRAPANGVPTLGYDGTNTDDIALAQVQARDWVLARQAILLTDDGGDPFQHMISPGLSSNPAGGFINAHPFLFNPAEVDGSPIVDFGWPLYSDDLEVDAGPILNNRVDISSMTSADVRDFVRGPQDRSPLTYDHFDQRERMLWSLFHPRAERRAPSIDYRDEFLTNSVIATACSSFIVEWTYDAKSGNVIQPPGERRWYGVADPDRGVQPLFDWDKDADSGVEIPEVDFDGDGSPDGPLYFAQNIEPDEPGIESFFIDPQNGVEVYDAVFGYDKTLTPWPSALRITMTLHDPRGRLEQGRTVQFVIELDK